MIKAQEWLKSHYEDNKNKNDITEIRISKGVELEGELIIADYPNLKDIFLGSVGEIGVNKGITKLEILNCPSVRVLFVSNNQLIVLELKNLPALKKLSIIGNKIEKIDLSENKQLEMLSVANNPANLEIIGLSELTSLVSWDSYKTFPLTKILNQASEAELKEIAKELGISIEGKSLEDIKKAIKDEVEKNKQNREKLDKDLPGLLNKDGQVDDSKLNEIKVNAENGSEYQKLVDKPSNASIVSQGKIDQDKLTDALKELEQLHDVTNHKDNERILDNGKFIQEKLDKELAKGNDYNELVKNNPNLVTDGKIDPAKIKDLGEKGENFKQLENAMKEAGIDLNNIAEAKKIIGELNALKERVMELFGKEDYKERLEISEYQANVEMPTNN